MFDVGYSEILVIAIVLIVVVGPKDLPKMLRAFGKMMTKFRSVSGDFRRQFDDALKEAELDEVRKTITDMKALDPRNQLRDALNPLRDAGASLRNELNKPVMPVRAASAAPVQLPPDEPKAEAPAPKPGKVQKAKVAESAAATAKPVKSAAKAAKASVEQAAVSTPSKAAKKAPIEAAAKRATGSPAPKSVSKKPVKTK